ncbi:efflux RND transporter periplasmic adaptor subunit [Pseudomonas sp. R2.Fl]|nr:efflux RND transporter periplasmic adaptor subunit [Pseudomonas sp. R2.Fl]
MVRHPISAAAALLAFSVALAPAAFSQEAGSEPQQILPSIVVTEAKVRPLVDRVIATGTVRPVQEVFIQPLVDGLSIRSLELDVGDEVPAEGVVARLNDDALLLQKSQLAATLARAEASLAQYQAQAADARANAAEASRQYERAKTLGKNGTFSQSQVDQAETAAASAAARLEAAEKAIAIAEADIKVTDSQIADIDLRLARTDVKSPVAGVVSARNAKIGAIASGAGEPMFTVIRDGEIELVAEVSETDILKIKAGQKATIFVAGGAASLQGSVRLVSPVVDPQTRLGLIHIAIDEDDAARSGMYARAEIVVKETTAVALPLASITTGRDGTFARKVEDGVVRQAPIEIGIEDGGYVEIVSGLEEGDVVVAKAGAFVGDGDRINPVHEQQTAASN